MKTHKKNKREYFWYYIILLAFSACIQPDSRLTQALEDAGDNKRTIVISKDEPDIPVNENEPIYLCLSKRQE